MSEVVSEAFDAKIALMTYDGSFNAVVHAPGDKIGVMHIRYLPRIMRRQCISP